MITALNTKILLSGAAILMAVALIIGATFAFFSDTETSTGNTLIAGALDLKIDNESYYNGVLNAGTSWLEKDLESGDFFYNFNDVKPGDFGEDTISLHIINNDAWVCTETTITSDDDVSCSEPENADDPLCTDPGAPGNTNDFDGDLADELEIMWWADDGDNVLESDEQVIDIGAIGQGPQNVPVSRPIADSANNIFSNSPNDPLEGGDIGPIHYIAKAWCFGNMTPAGLPQSNYSGPDIATNAADLVLVTSEDGGFTCDASAVVGNAAITDKVMMNVSFSAVQSRSNSGFVCGQPNVTLTPTLSPTPTPIISCTENDAIFATSFSNNDQGLQKSGAAVLANRSVPSAAFGAPQSLGLPVDGAVPAGSFFSLGFPNVGTSSATASIVFGFSEPFFNGPGGDLNIYEITGATTPPYPDEIVKVEVGPTSVGPWTVVAAGAIRDELIDINPVVSAQFVRLTDVSNITLFPNDADGYDLDAIKALCTEQ